MKDHTKGILITCLGVLILTPDSLLIRLTDAHFWTTSFWRGIISGVSVIAFLLLFHRQQFLRQCRTMRATTIAGLIPYTLGTILFVYSINNTLVSHSLIIIATIPIFTAIYSFIFLGEKVSRLTACAIVMTTAGVLVIASGDLLRESTDGANYILGDLAAVGSALCFATNITLARAFKQGSSLPMIGFSGILVAIASWFFAPSLSVSEPISWLVILINGAIVVPVSFGLILAGPRYISAPEVALLMLIETFLGPLWVWIGIGEYPGIYALVGGGIVVVTLIIVNGLQMRGQRVR